MSFALPRSLTKRALRIALIGLLLLAGAQWGLSRWAVTQANDETDRLARDLAQSNGRLLQSELQKFRLLPLVLAEYPDVRAVIEGGGTVAASRINPKLELLADRTDAAVIYIIDARGETVAASNYRQPSSFVGQNYGFRPYYGGAMRTGSAELFAVGTVSGKPGLYIARRIGSEASPLGVVVVKIEFDALQMNWQSQAGVTLVTDDNGVVIVASKPEWRFRSLTAIDAQTRRRIQSARQYSDMPLTLLRTSTQGGIVQLPGGDPGGYRLSSVQGAIAGSTLHTYFPVAPALASANTRARLLSAGVAILLLALLALWWRIQERRHLEDALRKTLEVEVENRTQELREANTRLIQESHERQLANERYRKAREELAQASRLGSLGQITAGVAHEINQPLAAIRTFAENAQEFLARSDEASADKNLSRIVELTQRIGRITGELREFAKRRTPRVGEVELSKAIESALLLISSDRSRVRFECGGDALGHRVWADRVRLEQVFINLLQNALQALDGVAVPVVRITATRTDGQVVVDVTDNGAGVSPDLADQLFAPFVTGREDGLGLGLAISRSIVREFGGELSLGPDQRAGGSFRIFLRQA